MRCRFLLPALAAMMPVMATSQNQGYTLHKAVDTKGTGGLAFVYQIPQGWSAQDNILWSINLRKNPMSYSFMVSSPDHKMWMSYLSSLTFDFLYRGGQLAAGKAPPTRASDFLVENANATMRGKPYQVVEQKDTPIDFPGQTVPGVTKKAYHSTLTIRFDVGQTQCTEQFSMDLYGYIQNIGGGAYSGNWFVSGLEAMNSPTENVATAQQVFSNVLNSERMTKDFANKYQQVCQMLLAKTRAETEQMRQQRAQRVIYSGGGGGAHAMNKDEFILHEEIRGLRAHVFNYMIGN